MPNLHERFRVLHLDTQFLPELALQRRQGVFTRFRLAAGKFPFSALVTVGKTTGNEHPAPIRQNTYCHGYRRISSGTLH